MLLGVSTNAISIRLSSAQRHLRTAASLSTTPLRQDLFISADPAVESPAELSADDRRRICDALRYLGRDLHHRSFAVTPERRDLLWQEMDQCLALADRLAVPPNA